MNEIFTTDSIKEFAAAARKVNAGIGIVEHSWKDTGDKTILIYVNKNTSDFAILKSLVDRLAGEDE